MSKITLPANFRFYKLDGMELPSVTSILGAFGEADEKFKKFAATPEGKELLDFKAKVGTIVHNKIAEYFIKQFSLDKGKPMKVNFQITQDMEIEAGAAMSYFDDFIKKFKVVPIEVEKKVWHRKMKYAGTADFLGTINGIPCVVDWKTSSTIRPDYPSQIMAYKQAMLSDEEFKTEIKMGVIVNINARKGLTVGKVIDEAKAWDGFLTPFGRFQTIFRNLYEQIDLNEVRICQNTTGAK